MKNLAQGRLSDEVLRVRWAALLPTHIQPFLKVLPSTSLQDLATLADRLLEGQPQVAEINQPPAADICVAANNLSLQRQIDDLRTIVTALASQLADQRARSDRGRFRSRSRSQQRGAAPQQPRQTCYYHSKWGSAARNCQQPCSFNTQAPLNP